MCAMTGLNILSLTLCGEGVLRTGEGVVGCQSNVQHDSNSLKRTYSPIHLFTHSLKKRAAFTLAEVLITLGIIGIVAAMTLPSLVANYRKKQFQSGLSKGYSVLLQALDMYKQDNGEALTKSDCAWNQSTFVNYLKPYLNILVDCGDTYDNTSCLQNGYYSDDGKYTYKTYSGKTATEDFFDDGQLILNDGSMLMFENTDSSAYKGVVYVTIDVNGYLKLPNKWGEDTFTFQLMDDGKLLPMGADGTDYDEEIYCSKNSSDNKNGIACANKALYDNAFWK